MPLPQGLTIAGLIVDAIVLVLGVAIGKYVDTFIEHGPKQSRFKSLRGFYKGTIKQGARLDLCTLKLKARGRSRLSGLLSIRYQEKDGSYEQNISYVVVRGHFRHDTLLILEYQSLDAGKKQAGAILLNYDSNKLLSGSYIYYFEPVSDDRKEVDKKTKTIVQEISLTPCAEQEAANYLNSIP